MKLNYLHLCNFKCFRNKRIPFGQLTALLGTNGVGKSSVIQSLLLLKTTKDEPHKKGDIISLNGPYGMSLGTSMDVMTTDVNDGFVKIAVSDGVKIMMEAIYDVNSSREQLGLTINGFTTSRSRKFSMNYVYFLSAERLGPRVSQPIKHMEYLDVGSQGEFTAQVIDYNSGREKVRKACMAEGTKDPTLPKQVDAWLDFILPGVKIVAKADYPGLSANIRIENKFSGGNTLLPTNIGFGISYVLPIITTGLVAKEGGLIIVENPEAHLHPAAQSAMGEFLGMVAQSGVTVLVETHSDHIINGIQLYAAKHPQFANQIVINNFSEDGDDQPKVETIQLTEKGEFENWPRGFLDQSQKDYLKLMEINNKQKLNNV